MADALGAERSHREIEIAAKLHHPHILPLLDSGEADNASAVRRYSGRSNYCAVRFLLLLPTPICSLNMPICTLKSVLIIAFLFPIAFSWICVLLFAHAHSPACDNTMLAQERFWDGAIARISEG